MKYRMFFILTLFLFMTLSFPAKQASAFEKASHSSAKLVPAVAPKPIDNRALILEAFLRKFDSPLAPYAHVFVREADKYNLDWKFVAAISGIESTFAKRYPQGTYNAWGWGIYGTNMHYFSSWEDAISTISRELRMKYMNIWGATDVYGIGRFYAASPTWAKRVTYFMNQIEAFATAYNASVLSISL